LDNLINYNDFPQGTTVTDTTVSAGYSTIDTSVPGTYTGQITIAHPDGTADDVFDILVIVEQEQIRNEPKLYQLNMFHMEEL